MAAKDSKNKRVAARSPEISSADDLREDPLREESTDFRGPGEKFEIMPEGKNLDLTRIDQPRHNLESLPKAHKDKARVPAPGAGGLSGFQPITSKPILTPWR